MIYEYLLGDTPKLNADILIGNQIPTSFDGLYESQLVVGDTPITGGGGLPDWKVRVVYNDGTPDFYVLDNGSTTLTQAEGTSILDNHDSATIEYLIFHSRLRHFANFALNGYAGGGNGDARWQNLDANILFMDGLETIGITTMADYTSQSRIIRLPRTLKMLGNWMFSEYDNFNMPFTIPASVNELREGCFNGWYIYQQDLKFESVTPPAIVQDCFKTWFNNFPAKIVTGDPTNTDGDYLMTWKTKFSGAYGSGNIASVNGVTWANIEPSFKIKVTYLDATPNFYVPVDGTTEVTQADGDLAINNGDHLQIDTITIGDGMTVLGMQAFRGYNNPKWKTFVGNIILPDTITNIKGYVFREWESFNNTFILSSNSNIIEDFAFQDWKSYNKAFSVPASVTWLGTNLFAGWNVFDNDFVFESSTPPSTIQGTIFSGWKNYHPAKIVVGDGTINEDLMAWKTALVNSYNGGDIASINGIPWDAIGAKAYVTYTDGTSPLFIPNDGTTIITQADGDAIITNHDYTKIDTVTIMHGITELGDMSLKNGDWQNFNSDIVLPNTLLVIGVECTLSWQKFDKAFVLPQSLTTIKNRGLSFWSVYSSVMVIPPNVNTLEFVCLGNWGINASNQVTFQSTTPPTNIESTVFRDRHNNPVVILTGDPTNTDSAYLLTWKTAFTDSGANGEIASINGVLWNEIGNVAKLTYTDDSVAYIPDDGTHVCDKPRVNTQLALDGKVLDDVKGVVFIDGVTEIRDTCRDMKYLSMPLHIVDSVTSIDGYGLYACPRMVTGLTFGTGVALVNGHAFRNWTGYNDTNITFPDNITQFSSVSFSNWINMLGTITFEHTTPPDCYTDAFISWGTNTDPAHKIDVLCPNTTATLLEWKTALTGAGAFASINGIPWDAIGADYVGGILPDYPFLESDYIITDISKFVWSADNVMAENNAFARYSITNERVVHINLRIFNNSTGNMSFYSRILESHSDEHINLQFVHSGASSDDIELGINEVSEAFIIYPTPISTFVDCILDMYIDIDGTMHGTCAVNGSAPHTFTSGAVKLDMTQYYDFILFGNSDNKTVYDYVILNTEPYTP